MKEQTTSNDLFRDRSPTVVALDNLIRRNLRVSDPNDPTEVAGALKKLYRADKEAMDREAGGLPFLQISMPSTAPVAATSSQAEVDQAVGDVERDLTALSTNSLLKDIQPELSGWGSAIRAAMADGINAARMALDPRQRDLAFSMRRSLGDYARVSRYAGAMTPSMSAYYRRLAQSLDEVAGVLLVLMGEALANIGFSGGRFLLQAPVSELQERRDAVIMALENLIGSAREAYGSDQWPRGLEAYRQLLRRLDTSGHSDLKALFQPNTIARLMDDLIDRAAGHTANGLRALGATANVALESFRRLIAYGRFVADPESPSLATFLSSIQLFMDAFSNSTSGYRLLFISRPPILFYGLYGINGPDEPSNRLLQLIIHRGRLAEQLDCIMECECDTRRIGCQILLDKILYDVDRAIDLYALGPVSVLTTEPELRAAAYAFVIEEVLENSSYRPCFNVSPQNTPVDEVPCQGNNRQDLIFCTLREMRNLLQQAIPVPLVQAERDCICEELCVQFHSEVDFENLLSSLAPSCERNRGLLLRIRELLTTVVRDRIGRQGEICPEFEVRIPRTVETSWESLLEGMDSSGLFRR